jgi:hypothetical protein
VLPRFSNRAGISLLGATAACNRWASQGPLKRDPLSVGPIIAPLYFYPSHFSLSCLAALSSPLGTMAGPKAERGFAPFAFKGTQRDPASRPILALLGNGEITARELTSLRVFHATVVARFPTPRPFESPDAKGSLIIGN